MDILELCIKLLGGSPDSNGEYWRPCPFCGKEKDHFSYSVRGYKCFACTGPGSSLKTLLERLGQGHIPVTRTAPSPKPKNTTPRRWQRHPRSLVDGYVRHPDRVALWQAYRPFTLETLNKYYLGVGVLPSSRCKHQRLIYPVFEKGEVVGLRGRAIECECKKWLQAAGSTARLWVSHPPQDEKTGIVCESPVDGMFAVQETPGIVTVAGTCGAGTWKEEWTEYLVKAMRCIERWIVWLDNDIVGQATGKTRQRLIVKWRAEHPKAKHLPRANGPHICNQMLEANLDTVLYRWPETSPAKMDLSERLMKC